MALPRYRSLLRNAGFGASLDNQGGIEIGVKTQGARNIAGPLNCSVSANAAATSVARAARACLSIGPTMIVTIAITVSRAAARTKAFK